jgi:hypothetical protein
MAARIDSRIASAYKSFAMPMIETESPSGGACVCVLGMHRSGTSALVRMLGLLGVEIGSDFCPAAPDNPTGFWELQSIVQTHDELFNALKTSFDDFWPLPPGWEMRPEVESFRKKLAEIAGAQLATRPLWGFKDPRTCRLAPIWRMVFNELGASPRYVIVLRHPREIARSLAAQNGMSINHALLMTFEHLRAAESSTRGEKRIIITYEQLLADWRGTAVRIATELRVTWPHPIDQAAQDIETFLDPSRRHQRAGGREKQTDADRRILDLAEKQHDILVKAAHGDLLSTRAIDRLNARHRAELPRHLGWRESKSPRHELRSLVAWCDDRTRAIEYLANENRWFREKLAERQAEPAPAAAAPE